MEREQLEQYIAQSLNTREIAELNKIDQATVMYWLRKFKLKTVRALKDGKKICRDCKLRFNKTEFYKGGGTKTSSYCKTCVSNRNNTNRKLIKLKAIEYLGGCCNKCRYNKCSAALEFHHVNPLEKDRKYNNIRKAFTPVLISELNKCILLCANCHRELHHL